MLSLLIDKDKNRLETYLFFREMYLMHNYEE